MLFESLSHVINQESHVKVGENLPRSFLKFWNFPGFTREISKFQKCELGKFIPNFPIKHVITSANLKTLQIGSAYWRQFIEFFKVA